MAKEIVCISVGTYREALTRGHRYELFALDPLRHQVRIRGDHGRTRWFPASHFDLEGAEASVIVRWQFDDPIDDEAMDWVEVTVDLSDGSRRWCIFITPERIAQYLTRPGAEPGMWGAHIIAVLCISPETVERVLRELDQQGELIECTMPLESVGSSDEERDEVLDAENVEETPDT